MYFRPDTHILETFLLDSTLPINHERVELRLDFQASQSTNPEEELSEGIQVGITRPGQFHTGLELDCPRVQYEGSATDAGPVRSNGFLGLGRGRPDPGYDQTSDKREVPPLLRPGGTLRLTSSHFSDSLDLVAIWPAGLLTLSPDLPYTLEGGPFRGRQKTLRWAASPPVENQGPGDRALAIPLHWSDFSHAVALAPTGPRTLRPAEPDLQTQVFRMDAKSGLKTAREFLSLPVQRLIPTRKKQVGSAPGTLVYTGPEPLEPVGVSLIEYDEDHVDERVLPLDSDFHDLAASSRLTWINVDGLSDLELIRGLGSAFDLHPLVLEDLVSTGQRPKAEEYDEYFFLVLRMLTMGPDRRSVLSEQVGIVLGSGFVLSFQERAGDVWKEVRERIRGKGARIRSRGADYLAYALIDAVVDHYFHVLEAMAEAVEELEVEVLEAPTTETMHQIHKLRQEMLVVRRAIWPLRDLTNALIRTESELIEARTEIYLRDVYDHSVQVMDTSETLRDVTSGLMDLYLSSVSNRMNEVMKVLTIMASVFIPLTFLAGIYGMNFENMPELSLPWAYPTLLAVMIVVGVGLIYLFKRRDWL